MMNVACMVVFATVAVDALRVSANSNSPDGSMGQFLGVDSRAASRIGTTKEYSQDIISIADQLGRRAAEVAPWFEKFTTEFGFPAEDLVAAPEMIEEQLCQLDQGSNPWKFGEVMSQKDQSNPRKPKYFYQLTNSNTQETGFVRYTELRQVHLALKKSDKQYKNAMKDVAFPGRWMAMNSHDAAILRGAKLQVWLGAAFEAQQADKIIARIPTIEVDDFELDVSTPRAASKDDESEANMSAELGKFPSQECQKLFSEYQGKNLEVDVHQDDAANMPEFAVGAEVYFWAMDPEDPRFLGEGHKHVVVGVKTTTNLANEWEYELKRADATTDDVITVDQEDLRAWREGKSPKFGIGMAVTVYTDDFSLVGGGRDDDFGISREGLKYEIFDVECKTGGVWKYTLKIDPRYNAIFRKTGFKYLHGMKETDLSLVTGTLDGIPTDELCKNKNRFNRFVADDE